MRMKKALIATTPITTIAATAKSRYAVEILIICTYRSGLSLDSLKS